jgi:predicted NBD/HSP70 family sugar kinase
MRTITGKPNLIKLVNKNLILELLEKKGPISRAELAKISKISPPTVSAIVEELIAEGIVSEIGEGNSSGGRKPTMLAYNPYAFDVIAVELKEGKIHCIATNLAGKVLVEQRYNWEGKRLVIEQLMERIRQFLREAEGRMKGHIKGVGIAIPGVTDIRRGVAIQATELGWKEVPLRDWLENELQMPVVIDNDVNMAALGEHWCGVGQHVEDLVFVSVGKGIGAGLVLNGELYRGATFSTGEIGYMIVSPHTLLDVEEGYGPLEHHYGQSAIERILRERPERDNPMVVGEMVRHLAYAFINVVSLINPKLLVLDLPALLEGEFDRLKALIQRYAPADVEIERSALKGYATLLGAVCSVIRAKQTSVVFRE